MSCFYRLRYGVSIRKVGEKLFLVNPHHDYTKDTMPEITEKGAQIIERVRNKDICDETIRSEFGNDVLVFLDYLFNHGYVFKWNDSHQKTFISDLVKTRWSETRTFYGCTFEITPKCNFNCIHCYLDGAHSAQNILSGNAINGIIDKLYDNGLFLIFFSGGDPFVHPDFKKIYAHTRKLGILCELFTNGYAIDDDWIELFRCYPPVEIDISLYGSNEEIYYKATRKKGAFNRVIQNIKRLKAEGFNVSLKSPIFSLLKDDLENMINLAKELDVPFRFSFEINPTIYNESKQHLQVSASEAADLFYRYDYQAFTTMKATQMEFEKTGRIVTRKKYLCSTGRCSGFIDYQGNFCPCIEMRDKGISLLENDFDCIWKEVKENSFNTLENSDEYKCLSCNMISFCKSCPAIRERKYGSPTIVKEEDCAFTETLYNKMKNEFDEREGGAND